MALLSTPICAFDTPAVDFALLGIDGKTCMFDKMVQELAAIMRAPTKLKENYRPGRKELANAIRALTMDTVQKAKC